jgi:PTH1 family peptidyl-tRNA hydrolase
MVVDGLAGEFGIHLKKPWLKRFMVGQGRIAGGKLVLAKPLVFMNESGQVVSSLLSWAAAEAVQLLVVYDNVDLSPGNCRFKLRGSAGGHNGLESVTRFLGDAGFMRLAVGVGRPPEGGDMVRHVLSPPRGEEATLLRSGVEAAVSAIASLPESGAERVMNDLNRREP